MPAPVRMLSTPGEPKKCYSHGWFLLVRDGELRDTGYNFPEGPVFVIWSPTRDEINRNLDCYVRDKGSDWLKEVPPDAFHHECDFGQYPDGSFLVINATAVQDFEDWVSPELREEFEAQIEELEEQAESLAEQLQDASAQVDELAHLEEENYFLAQENRDLENKNEELEEAYESAAEEASDFCDENEVLIEQQNQLKARVAELELLLTCPEVEPMVTQDIQLENSHDDLPSMEEMMTQTVKNVQSRTCKVCNKTLKTVPGLQSHLRSTECGQKLYEAFKTGPEHRGPINILREQKPESVLLAEIGYKRDVMKFQFMQTCVRWITTAIGASAIVYHWV